VSPTRAPQNLHPLLNIPQKTACMNGFQTASKIPRFGNHLGYSEHLHKGVSKLHVSLHCHGCTASAAAQPGICIHRPSEHTHTELTGPARQQYGAASAPCLPRHPPEDWGCCCRAQCRWYHGCCCRCYGAGLRQCCCGASAQPHLRLAAAAAAAAAAADLLVCTHLLQLPLPLLPHSSYPAQA